MGYCTEPAWTATRHKDWEQHGSRFGVTQVAVFGRLGLMAQARIVVAALGADSPTHALFRQ